MQYDREKVDARVERILRRKYARLLRFKLGTRDQRRPDPGRRRVRAVSVLGTALAPPAESSWSGPLRWWPTQTDEFFRKYDFDLTRRLSGVRNSDPFSKPRSASSQAMLRDPAVLLEAQAADAVTGTSAALPFPNRHL